MHQQWSRWSSTSYGYIRALRHQRDVRFYRIPARGRQPHLGWSKHSAEFCRRVDAELEEGGELVEHQLHPVELIASIVRQPKVGEYVRDMSFEGVSRFMLEDAEGQDSQRVEVAKAYLHEGGRLERFLERNRWLRAAGQDVSLWASSILQEQDTERWCSMLLLTLVPNLRNLQLNHEWRYSSYGCGLSNASADPAMENVLRVLRETIGPHGHTALPCLHTLERFYCDPKFGMSLQAFVPFLLLPSLKRFEALSVETALSSYEFRWPENVECSVPEIELFDPALENEHIAAFFGRMTNLKRLFIWQCRWSGTHWDASAWAPGITNSPVPITLEVLELRLENQAASNTFIGSLKGLKKLKKLTLDAQALKRSIGNDTNDGDGDGPRAVYASLTSVLPERLEELQLEFWDKPSEEDASRLFFDGFAEFIAGSLRLKTFRLIVKARRTQSDWPRSSWVDTLADQMQNCGVEFIVGFNVKPR